VETHSHSEAVLAPIAVCFETLVDFEQYPQWFRMITSARVEAADPAAGQWTVAYELDAVVKKIRYTLAYQSERPHRLTWKLVAGDLKDIQGTYELIELEPDLTDATCTQALDIGMWVPGPIRRMFEMSALADSVREFKKAAEARAAASA
jgi:hypothetical protein